MALTRRGKAIVAGGAVIGLLSAGIGALTLTGNADVITGGINRLVRDEPPTCPLTGLPLAGDNEPPARPVLAIKVENTPDAQPLAGLQQADIVYEEVVEGGITRFMALYNCHDATRVGPVRSARTTDPKILAPYGVNPLFAYAGGSTEVVKVVEQAKLSSMTEELTSAAFERDDAREVPHNLFTSTKALYKAGAKLAPKEAPPASPFTFDASVPKPNKNIRSATIVFSGLATAEWRWEKDRWVRYLDGRPMDLEDGTPIHADNIVIQMVKTTQSDLTDVLGYPSPEVQLAGGGTAWVLRDGRVIRGTWERPDEHGFTALRTHRGDEIALRPGTTYVELAPTGMFNADITFG